MAKTSIVSMARGAVYAGSAVLPQYGAYKQASDAGFSTKDALTYMMERMQGIDKFQGINTTNLGVLWGQYGPLVTWTVMDTLGSKFGVWRKMGRLIGNLGG